MNAQVDLCHGTKGTRDQDTMQVLHNVANTNKLTRGPGENQKKSSTNFPSASKKSENNSRLTLLPGFGDVIVGAKGLSVPHQYQSSYTRPEPADELRLAGDPPVLTVVGSIGRDRKVPKWKDPI